jgi:hypothetical protein
MDPDPDPTPILIQLLSSVTLEMQKKFHIFAYNLPAGTLSSGLQFKFFVKICIKILFASIISVRSTPL